MVADITLQLLFTPFQINLTVWCSLILDQNLIAFLRTLSIDPFPRPCARLLIVELTGKQSTMEKLLLKMVNLQKRKLDFFGIFFNLELRQYTFAVGSAYLCIKS